MPRRLVNQHHARDLVPCCLCPLRDREPTYAPPGSNCTSLLRWAQPPLARGRARRGAAARFTNVTARLRAKRVNMGIRASGFGICVVLGFAAPGLDESRTYNPESRIPNPKSREVQPAACSTGIA